MALTCQSPDCDHEFHDSVIDSPVESREQGELPFFARTYDMEGLTGVVTDYICSTECMRDYLDHLENGGGA